MGLLFDVYALQLKTAADKDKKTYPISRALTNQTGATLLAATHGALRAGGLGQENPFVSAAERARFGVLGALAGGAVGGLYNSLRRTQVARAERPNASTSEKIMKWINPLDAVIYSRALKGRRALGTEWYSEKK
jgi:hypothetical protein